MSGHTLNSGPATRIALQQHSRLLRDSLAHWLTGLPGYVVVGVTANKVDLVRLCLRCQPDVIVLEIGPDGPAEFARPSGERTPYLIGLYGTLEVIALPRLREVGVHRLVSVQAGLGGLHAALEAARTAHRRPQGGDDVLTERELEVLSLICGGWSTTRIAAALAISPHTVVNHTRRIFMKLDVRSRTQAAAKAAALGLCGERGTPGHGLDRRAEPVVLVNPTAEEWSIARAQDPDVVVVLSDPRTGGGVAAAVARGAAAVLGDESLAEHLPHTMAMVRAGYLVAPAHPVRTLLAATHSSVAPLALTRRERDILNSVARGDTVRQTAQALGIAVKTVQNEQRQLFGRLGVRNRTEALMLARRLGLVDPHNVRPDDEIMVRLDDAAQRAGHGHG
jgi:DNA-binding NarL/FixJ family response regulator